MKPLGSAENVPLTLLRPDPKNHRPVLDPEDPDDRAFIESLRTCGIQTPLQVAAQADGTYVIVSGHRRFYAAQILRMQQVPCVLYRPNTADPFLNVGNQIAVNDMHRPMPAWMRMRLLGEIASERVRDGRALWDTVRYVSRQVGKPPKSVYRYVQAYSLITPEVRHLLHAHVATAAKLSLSQLVKLSKLPAARQQIVAQQLMGLTLPAPTETDPESTSPSRTAPSTTAQRVRRLPRSASHEVRLAGVLRQAMRVKLKASKRTITWTMEFSPQDAVILDSRGVWTPLLRDVFYLAGQAMWDQVPVDASRSSTRPGSIVALVSTSEYGDLPAIAPLAPHDTEAP